MAKLLKTKFSILDLLDMSKGNTFKFTKYTIKLIIFCLFFCFQNCFALDMVNVPPPIYPFTPKTNKPDQLVLPWALDDQGVLLREYDENGKKVKRYNPAFIASYGIEGYKDYLELRDRNALKVIDAQVNWLLNHHEEFSYLGKKYWLWSYQFDYPAFNAKVPWYSAFAQGRIMDLFLYKYAVSGDTKYYDAANYAFNAFLVPMSKGGVTTFKKYGAWFEEVAAKNVHGSQILNGHISALAGLWVYSQFTHDKQAKELVNAGISAVVHDFPLYDAGYLSYYSAWPTNPKLLAPAYDYNTQHIYQFLWLYSITNNPVFLEYAFCFSKYENLDYKIKVKGSTDPKEHGESGLLMHFGYEYWSHNQFPTWIEVDLKKSYLVDGITILGHTKNSSPKNLLVYVKENGKFKLIKTITNNVSDRLSIKLPRTMTQNIKILINSDNGNGNVALAGVYVHRVMSNPQALTNFENFGVSNRPEKIFFDGWLMPQRGWLLIDKQNEQSRNAVIKIGNSKSINDDKLEIFVSNDLVHFVSVKPKIIQKDDVTTLFFDSKGFRYIKENINLSKALSVKETVSFF